MKCTNCILLLMITMSSEFTLDSLETSNGIIYSSFHDAYIQTSTESLNYVINFYQLDYLQKYKNDIIHKCIHKAHITMQFGNQLARLEAFQNKSNKSRIPSNPIEINLTFDYISQLNDSSSCGILNNITYEIMQINDKLNNLINQNKFAILNFINLDTLRSDLKTFLRSLTKKSNAILSFDQSKPIRTEFFEQVDFFYYFDNEILIIGYNIPFYQKNHLFKLNPRSMFINGTFCIYKTEVFYASNTLSNLILYSNSSYAKLCNWNKYLDKTFCRNPTKARDCDKAYILHRTSTFNAECFKPLPERNMANRRNNDLFLTLFSPLSIKIECGIQNYTMQLNSSTKISDINDCSVNA